MRGRPDKSVTQIIATSRGFPRVLRMRWPIAMAAKLLDFSPETVEPDPTCTKLVRREWAVSVPVLGSAPFRW